MRVHFRQNVFSLSNSPSFFLYLPFFLGVGKKFGYLCNHCFFSRPFNENFKFLKNRPNDFHKLCIVILHPKVHPPASAMASKSYNCDVGNSPNLTENDQKTTTFQPFHFPENSSYDSNEISYSFLHHIRFLYVQFYQPFDCDSRESDGKRPKPSPLRTCGSGSISSLT